MKKGNKILMALLIGSMTLIGAAGVVSARGHGYGGYGGYGGNGYSDPFANLSPEARQSMIDAREAMTPLFVQYRAKRAELNAKIYSGADDRTIQALGKEVEALHSQLLAARVNMEKQMAKAGVPMRGGMGGGFGGCPGWGQGGMGGGMGGRHGGGHGGGGWGGGHGWGGGPGSMMHDGYMYNNPMPQTMPQQQGGQNNR